MSQERWHLSGNAAEIYQERLVPAIFSPWASKIVTAAGIQQGERVLDVACGTGVVARLAAERVGSRGQVTGLDLNPAMLAVARSLGTVDAPIQWEQGNAERLPFPAAVFDVVCCQLGLQYFPDRLAALREMARVLVKNGRLATLVWRSIEHSPGYDFFAQALDRHIGPASGAMMRAPFALGDEHTVRELVSGAGFSEIDVSIESGLVRFRSVRDMLVAQVGASPLAGPVAESSDDARAALLVELEDLLEPWLRPDGEGVEFPIEGIVTRARA